MSDLKIAAGTPRETPTSEAPLEAGRPADDTRAFRRALGHFATGVTVVTATHGERLAGLTVNSFASVSLDPPLVLCSIAKSSRSASTFEQASHFAVNVMASDQIGLASGFAGSSEDKFAGVSWRPGQGGAPLLAGAAASFECRVHSRVDGGDHVVMLGEVESFARHDKPLLLYAQGRFGLAVDHPAARRESERNPAATLGVPQDESLLTLLWEAFSSLSDGFQADREAEGFNSNQSRVRSRIARYPDATMEVLVATSFVGKEAVEDAVAVLMAKGAATMSPDGRFTLTELGLEGARSLRRRFEALEARKLAGVVPEDVATTRRVLEALGKRQA